MDAAKRRVELGAELRAAREDAGRTQAQAATFLKCTQGKIAKIENGANDVKPHDLERLLQLYTPAEAQLLRIKELAAPPAPGRAASGQPLRAYVEFYMKEERANSVLALHSERLPVPLQSDRYRLKLFQESNDPTPQTTLILDRDHRAEVFTAPTRSTQYNVLLSESAFRRLPGGETPDLVIDQAEYILTSMERHERLHVQIVPFKARVPNFDPDFTVLKFADPREDVAYVDSSVDAQLIRAAQRVADRETYWHRIQRAAPSIEDSKQFLRTMIEVATAELAAGNS